MLSESVIIAGGVVSLSVQWFDMQGVAEFPSVVTYQLFDQRSGESLSAVVTVDNPTASMTFLVPTSGIAVPVNQRRVVIQVTGTFEVGSHTEHVFITIQRRYE